MKPGKLLTILGLALVLPVAVSAQGGSWTTGPSPTAYALVGNAFEYLEAGEEGEVSVVAIGRFEGEDSIPVVVRNNTNSVLKLVKVGGEVRDSSGSLLDVPTEGTVAPLQLDPGALGITQIHLSEIAPSGSTLSVKAAGDVGSLTGWHALELTEYVPKQGGPVGVVTNTTEFDLRIVLITLACFTDDGQLVDYPWVQETFHTLRSGESTPFRLLLPLDDEDCSTFLLSATGLEEGA